MVKTRIAPSPTGYIHIGTLRTALYNLFVAKQNGGTFLLRIEDTDRERFVEGATESLIKVMNTLGIQFDEGPYFQSERLSIYKEHVQTLIDAGHAYYDFATKEQLEEMRERQRILKQPQKYDRAYAEFDEKKALERIANGEAGVIRMKVPEQESILVRDLIRGEVRFSSQEVDDQVLIKSDGFPTYHLAVVVDDHLMNITHVIRGEEWLPSTPKHVLLYQMFGWQLPEFAHVPLLLNPDKSKLSKRQGDVAVEDYIKAGYVVDALLNFIATLGYNPTGDREIYSMEELIRLFDISKVNKAGAVLNKEKLDWMSGQYLKLMSAEEILQQGITWLSDVDGEGDIIKRSIEIEKNRSNTFPDLRENIRSYLWNAEDVPNLSSKIVWKDSTSDETATILRRIYGIVQELEDWSSVESVERAIRDFIQNEALSNGAVLAPLRIALSGLERSASPFEYLWVLQKTASLERIQLATTRLEEHN